VGLLTCDITCEKSIILHQCDGLALRTSKASLFTDPVSTTSVRELTDLRHVMTDVVVCVCVSELKLMVAYYDVCLCFRAEGGGGVL
jgi:hypothetical protein